MQRALTAAALSSVVLLARAQEEPAIPPEQQFPEVPLAQKRFEYDQLPYKVDTDVGLIRGVQHGYNICNSTTQNQESSCQTALFHSINQFCFWSAPEPNSEIGNIEGEAVAWCNFPEAGARLFPEGAITGLQFTKTPDYIQLVGYMDQTKLNLSPEDFGGEMDPHGADLRGNPMGGLVFSNAFTGQMQQVVEWHNFVGSGYFCMKACDPSGPNAADFCEHIYDRIGCAYNAPSLAQDNEFTSCEGDNQLFPGRYIENGQTMTYTQPPESLGAISTMPYTASVPASSNCQTFQSAELFSGAPAATGAASGSAGASGAAPTGGANGVSGVSSAPGSTRTSGAASGAAATGESNAASAQIASSGLTFQLIAGTVVSGMAIGAVQLL